MDLRGFVTLPLGYVIVTEPSRLRSLSNLLLAGLVAAPLVLPWYWPNLQALRDRFAATSAVGTQLEQDPAFYHVAGWLYYPRCL